VGAREHYTERRVGLVRVLPSGFIQVAARLGSWGWQHLDMGSAGGQNLTKSNQALAKGSKISF